MGKKQSTFIDLTGQVFGRWTVTGRTENQHKDDTSWLCRCECGTERIVSGHSLRTRRSKSCGCWNVDMNTKEYKDAIGICDCGVERIIVGSNLRYGLTRSCGCYNREVIAEASRTHGLSKSFEYNTWSNMFDRCYNPKNKRFRDYGERGIAVCERWHIFENFYEDMGPKGHEDLTIERIDVNLGYSKENCEWATRLTQSRNKRRSIRISHNGETKVLKEWVDILGLPYNIIHARIKHGWSFEKAIDAPIRKVNKSYLERRKGLHITS